MIAKKISCIFFIIFFNIHLAFSLDFKIVMKINNEIFTNIDIDNEKKYLTILNPNLQNISKEEINSLSKNSLIRQSIKKEEVEKYFILKSHSNLGENLIKDIYTNQGFSNKTEFSIFLESKGLSLKIFREKILIDKLWNTLIYEKFKKKIKIDEKNIKQRVKLLISSRKKVTEYNLSEILLDIDTDYIELIKFIDKYGFITAANKYSISDTSTDGGKIGWVNINNLDEKIKTIISSLNVGQISQPIEMSNGKLLIKINEIRELENQIDINEAVKKQINFEQNRQLKNFSINYYKKLKQNKIINEY